MLKHLKLENFRNHKNFELEIRGTVIITGPNGVGKSNILEAIALLSFCRSFREEDKKNLVNLDSDYARIIGDDLEIFIQKTPRLLIKNKLRGVFKRQSETIGQLKSVVFTPESSTIITGSPKLRRRFLDVLISQQNREYLRSLILYEKVRAERNSLLQKISKGEAKSGELSFWNKELVREGEKIIKERAAAVSFLSDFIEDNYQEISGNESDSLVIEYVQSVPAEEFEGKLKAMENRDIGAGRSLVGPHRDDLIFRLNSSNMLNFASRGEVRSAILALKMAEMKFLIKEDEEKPTLLLDDVFSEFDEKRRNHLLKLVSSYQSIITITEIDHLSKELLKNCQIIKLKPEKDNLPTAGGNEESRHKPHAPDNYRG